jgi:hypothetical protein
LQQQATTRVRGGTTQQWAPMMEMTLWQQHFIGRHCGIQWFQSKTWIQIHPIKSRYLEWILSCGFTDHPAPGMLFAILVLIEWFHSPKGELSLLECCNVPIMDGSLIRSLCKNCTSSKLYKVVGCE